MSKSGTNRGNGFLELAEQPPVSLGNRQGENRSSGFDLAFARMKSRRIGGAFVQDDVPLHVLDVIPKGNYPRSTPEERFVSAGSAQHIASQLVGEDGQKEIALEQELLARLQREEEEQRQREEEKLKNEAELEEAEERKKKDEAEARARAQAAAWEEEFYETSERAAPTAEETERKDLLVATALNLGIPDNLLSLCTYPSDVEELMDFRKQFDEIDVDRSGKLDMYEMKLAFSKLGLTLEENQLNALLNTTDSSGDGEVDFDEFVQLIRSFQSSEKEKSHQGSERSSMLGLADAARNMEISLEETEFGSKVVVKRRDIKEWENYMQYPDPLHWAAGKGDLRAVQQFIRGTDGAPIIAADWMNKDGKMPLHYAALWSQLHVIRFLLDPPPHGAGVGVDPPDATNCTPLLLAAEAGHEEACAVLLRPGIRNRVTKLLLGLSTATHVQ